MNLYTEAVYPRDLKGEKLDYYLDTGYFRGGQMMYRSPFLLNEEGVFSTVRIRFPMAKHSYGKRIRKLMRKNGNLFKYEIHKASFSKEKDALYRQHRHRFGPFADEHVDEYINLEPHSIFDTYEVCIYNADNKLVGLSFFDVGNNSIASIIAVFDRNYAEYSLGLYSMLLEIEYGKSNGIAFYYPGYFTPAYPKFDYKLRVGQYLDYYDTDTQKWQNFDLFDPQKLPAEKLKTQLAAAEIVLTKFKIPYLRTTYPFYEMWTDEQHPGLLSPLVLWCNPDEKQTGFSLIIEYIFGKECYVISIYEKNSPALFNWNYYKDWKNCSPFFYSLHNIIGITKDAALIPPIIARYLTKIKMVNR